MNRRRHTIMTVVAGASLLLGACANDPQAYKNARASALAVTAEQKARALSQERLKKHPLDQLGGWLDAVNEARLKLAADPADADAQGDYNFAVARVMDLIAEQKLAPRHQPVRAPSRTHGAWSLRLTSPGRQTDLSRLVLTPADRYDFRRLLKGERVTKRGLGTPLVVSSEDPDYAQSDPRVRPQSVYYGLTAVIRFQGRNCEVVLLDPLENDTVSLGGSTYPLAGDHQGPLALTLADLDPGKRKGRGVFEAKEPEPAVRLTRLEAFNPNKIPVLFIHGLGGSTVDWEPLLEFLRADPRIRTNYQFWFFSYSSLQPYATSAALLRSQLAAMRKRYPRAKEFVIVGHSMGGMIGRLLLTDSGRTLWNTYFGRPPGELPFSEVTRKVVTGSLIFKPVSGVSRAIFMSASHRGSEMATTFYGRLLATLLRNRISNESVYREALALARPEARSRGRDLLPCSSLELLAPDNLFIATVESLPIERGVPFHSIVGDRGKGGFLDHRKPASSDGVVPYWSSHLQGARSEKVIPSGHWSFLHPLGMKEVERILLEHLSR